MYFKLFSFKRNGVFDDEQKERKKERKVPQNETEISKRVIVGNDPWKKTKEKDQKKKERRKKNAD